MDAHAFLADLAVVLCTAAVVTVVFQYLRQPVVLGYILAGMLVGPHVPVPLVARADTVTMLSELGVILLMFALGLEFSLKRLVSVIPTAGLTGAVEMGVMALLGSTVARVLGMPPAAQLFVAGMMAFSSTMVIARVLDAQARVLRQTVLGVLVLEDLVAIVALAVLTAVAKGAAVTPDMLVETLLRLALFLVLVVAVGILWVPRFMAAVVALKQNETTVVASVGLCFASALLAQSMGYSVALGAFLAGSVVAQAGFSHAVEKQVAPLRDLFGAIFFVSVGMMVDPAAVWEHRGLVLALSAVVMVGKVVGNTAGALLGGHTLKTSVQAGMSMAQVGEFSFILATLGTQNNVLPPHMFAVIVAVSAVTSGLTPPLIKASTPVALWVDARLPKPVQTTLTLYGTWLSRIRSRPTAPAPWRRELRRGLALVTVGALTVGVVAGSATFWPQGLATLQRHTPWPIASLAVLWVTASALVAMPLVLVWLVVARSTARALAHVAFAPAMPGQSDPANGPRKTLTAVLHVAVVLSTGLPLLFAVSIFLPAPGGVGVLLAATSLLTALVWRHAAGLQGHVKASAVVAAELLRPAPSHANAAPDWEELLPGLGQLRAVRLKPGALAEGQTLASLNVRGLTGATVVAVRRGEDLLVTPTGREHLQPGDVLAVMGTPTSVQEAERLLNGPALSRDFVDAS